MFGTVIHNHFHITVNVNEPIAKKVDKMSQTVDDLTAAVTELKDASDSAVQLINNLADKIDAIGPDEEKLRELTAELRQESAELADAVVANTPVDPEGETPEGEEGNDTVSG